MDILGLWQKPRIAKRWVEVISVLVKYGFGSIIDQIHLGRFIPFGRRVRSFGHWPQYEAPSAAARLRVAFEELGPSFVKFAQILASRPDLITEQYSREFRKLQDQVPPFPANEAREIITSELGLPIEALFEAFDDKPLAAASIAQVHKALLKDGRRVIVKVQRPGIREQIESDISILTTIARQAEHYIPESRFMNPTGIVAEFRRTVRKELDFTNEARHCQQFSKAFDGNKRIHIPAVHTELLSERVLVMEYVEGVAVDDIAGIKAYGIAPRSIAEAGIDMYFKMILEDGFFHADPHPGNFIVMPSGKLCLVDYGIVGRMDEEMKEALAACFSAIVNRDMNQLLDSFVEMGIVPEDMDTPRFRREMKVDLIDAVEPIYGMPLKDVNIPESFGLLIKAAMKHRLKVPTDLVLLHKVLMMMESLGEKLDPDFNFVEAANPYFEKLVRENLAPGHMLGKAKKYIGEAAGFLTSFPRQVNRLLKKAIRDDLSIKFNHQGLEPLIKDMDRASNRIAFALVLAALLISSAIMHATGVGPKVYGLSVLGILVFGFAAFMGIWLIISIFRSGRL